MLLSDVCLSDVCLSVTYIGPKSRTERPRKTTIGTEVAHVTRTWLGHLFSRSKGQRHVPASSFLSAALMRKATAAVSVGTYSAWESTATLRLLVCSRGAWASTGEERGESILCRHAQSLLFWTWSRAYCQSLGICTVAFISKCNRQTNNSVVLLSLAITSAFRNIEHSSTHTDVTHTMHRCR